MFNTKQLRLSLLLMPALLPMGFVSAASMNRPEVSRGSVAALRPLEVRLETAPWYAQEDTLNVRFTLTNTNPHSIWILRWQLPNNRMDADLFIVTRDGQEVAYEGRLVKRAAPKASDYVEIKAGESYTVTIDPSSYYEMEGQGNYSIKLRESSIPLRTLIPDSIDNTHPSMLVDAGSVSREVSPTHQANVIHNAHGEFFFAGLPVEATAKGRENSGSQSVIGGYTSCTTTQKSQLQTALSNAATMTSKAKNQLAANPSGSSLYTYWFGTYNSTRYSTVKTHYNNLYSALSTKSYTFDCSCTDSAYAYVYPSQPYKVYLCRAYWSAPATGRDSKAGTLVHESSHFTVIAGTQDYVYGASGAHSLAGSNPAKAIMNADNHEYFAEDQ